MQQRLIVIDTEQRIEEVYVDLLKADIIAFDLETTGLLPTSEVVGMSFCVNESYAYYLVLSRYNPSNTELEPVLKGHQTVRDLIALLQTKGWIGHNALFDASMVENYFKMRIIDTLHTDTMVLSHLLDENRRKGLKELAKEYYGEDSTKEMEEMKASVIANGGKLTKKQYEMYKCDASILGKYGAKDALLTYKLFNDLVPELYAQGLEDFFYKDECMPLLRGPTYQLNNTGLKVDQVALTSLKKQLEAECAEAKAFIYSEIQSKICTKWPSKSKKDTFNIGSNQQLSELLFGIYELEFGALTTSGKTLAKSLSINCYTKSGKRNFIHQVKQLVGIVDPVTKKKIKEPWAYIAVDKKTLATIAPKLKWVASLLEYQRKTKLLNTYVNGIEGRIQYGIIRPSFIQTGTTSGRYASRDPNFQNLPRDDKRIKECIVARPGKVFVGADYSQLEPRVFAFFSKDERLIAAFKGTDDFYSVIGMEVYGKTDCTPQKEGPDAFGQKYKKLRSLSKVIALASTYGATANQLAPTTGKSVEDTQQDIDNYFERFPGVAEMMLEAHRLAKDNGQVTNYFGRPRRMPEAKKIRKLYGDVPHAELPYNMRSLLNLAVNHRIQSTGASICNRAMITFYNNIKELGMDAQIVCQVHDEIIVECDEKDAENCALILQDAMENTTHLGTVDLVAEPMTAHNFADLK